MTPERNERLTAVLHKRQPDLTIVLENVFDPHNISAVMRTADAVGIQDIFILNNKIPPHRKWGAKSSSSAAKWLTIQHMPIGVPRIIYCWGEELPAQWTDIYNFIFRRRMVFLMQYLDDELCNQFLSATSISGELFWPMPLPIELRASLDSPVADMANIGERMGGMMVAGLFLKEFIAPELPWLHLDIAGPAYNEGDPYGYTPVGGTGVALRSLVALAESAAIS